MIVVILPLVGIAAVIAVIIGEPGQPLRKRLRDGIVILVTMAGLFAILWLFKPLLERPAHIWSQYQDNVIGYGTILAIALFLLRRQRREIYGGIEVVIALLALYVFASMPGAGLVAWVAGFAAPVYIMIRGFDNIETGLREMRDLLTGLPAFATSVSPASPSPTRSSNSSTKR